MWTVIHIVPSEMRAKKIQDTLTVEGFLVRIRPVSKSEENRHYEILVPGEEAEEAYNILMETGLL